MGPCLFSTDDQSMEKPNGVNSNSFNGAVPLQPGYPETHVSTEEKLRASMGPCLFSTDDFRFGGVRRPSPNASMGPCLFSTDDFRLSYSVVDRTMLQWGRASSA